MTLFVSPTSMKTFYQSAVVSIALSCTVFELLDVLKVGLWVTQCHCK